MSDEMEDWRLRLLEMRNMYDRKFRWTAYKSPSVQWDYAHCAGCYAKFVEPGYPVVDWLQLFYAGYKATEGPAWLCEECFRDYRDHFRWQLKSDSII